jgi:prepilin-type processing-associated H-X9-DG protein
MRLALAPFLLSLWLAPAGASGQSAVADHSAISPAKDAVTFADLLKGDRFPVSVKPSELPEGYRAFHIAASGTSDSSDSLSSPLAMLMFVPMSTQGSGSRQMDTAKILAVLELTWTSGQTIRVVGSPEEAAGSTGGEVYLVAYKADLSISDLMAFSDKPSQAANVTLKLRLIKFDSISSVVPEPAYNRENVAQMLGATGVDAEKEPGPADEAKRTVALSNAKQIGLGLLMYAADNDDYLPSVQGTDEVKKAIAPYLKNDQLWDTLNPKSRFLFNMCLSGVSQTAIPSPAETPMIYESAPGVDGKRIVAFADGHVKKVPEADWAGMAKFLKLKLPRRGH